MKLRSSLLDFTTPDDLVTKTTDGNIFETLDSSDIEKSFDLIHSSSTESPQFMSSLISDSIDKADVISTSSTSLTLSSDKEETNPGITMLSLFIESLFGKQPKQKLEKVASYISNEVYSNYDSKSKSVQTILQTTATLSAVDNTEFMFDGFNTLEESSSSFTSTITASTENITTSISPSKTLHSSSETLIDMLNQIGGISLTGDRRVGLGIGDLIFSIFSKIALIIKSIYSYHHVRLLIEATIRVFWWGVAVFVEIFVMFPLASLMLSIIDGIFSEQVSLII